MLEATGPDGAALYAATRIIKYFHDLPVGAESLFWLKSVNKSEFQLLHFDPMKEYTPLTLEVDYCVHYDMKKKVRIQVDAHRLIDDSGTRGDCEEKWKPIRATAFIEENDKWKMVQDFEFNWITEVMLLKTQYRPYPY